MFNKRVQKVALAAGAGYLGYKVADGMLQISSDIEFAKNVVPTMLKTQKLSDQNPSFTISDHWKETCDKNRNKVCLINADNDEQFTYDEVDRKSNQIAHWAIERGLCDGKVVALFMENRPEYVITLLGLTKAGAIIAFINSNNKQKALLHSIRISNCKAVIFGSELSENIEHVLTDLNDDNIALIASGPVTPNFATSFEEEYVSQLDGPLSPSVRKNSGFDSIYGFIYTSGTTGLPKACVIKHSKLYATGHSFGNVGGVVSSEPMYTCLPLYHSSAQLLGMGCLFTTGGTMVVTKKFSASRFFEHCTKYKVKVVQYIGELCRYLLNSKPTKWDRMHNIRIAIGNGLRREIWTQFCDRFNIPEIGEFYGATEGNVAFFNRYYHSKREGVGAIGRAGAIMKKALGFQIVKHDVANEVPVRDPATGFCIPCVPGESGELIGFIDDSKSFKRFEGYSNKEATEKKILTDAFVKGDKYFRTGDLVRHEADGYLYFVDRIGDTFRWKGENVSTNEVSEVVSVLPGIHEANVYGVQIPMHEDGRACMTAIVTESGEAPDMTMFANEMFKNLATYAIPMFVRVLPQMDITGTFKHRKVDFVKEGFDPNTLKDVMFYLDLPNKKYIPLTPEVYQQVVNQHSKL